jgi:hypothetical protein
MRAKECTFTSSGHYVCPVLIAVSPCLMLHDCRAGDLIAIHSHKQPLCLSLSFFSPGWLCMDCLMTFTGTNHTTDRWSTMRLMMMTIYSYKHSTFQSARNVNPECVDHHFERSNKRKKCIPHQNWHDRTKTNTHLHLQKQQTQMRPPQKTVPWQKRLSWCWIKWNAHSDWNRIKCHYRMGWISFTSSPSFSGLSKSQSNSVPVKVNPLSHMQSGDSLHPILMFNRWVQVMKNEMRKMNSSKINMREEDACSREAAVRIVKHEKKTCALYCFFIIVGLCWCTCYFRFLSFLTQSSWLCVHVCIIPLLLIEVWLNPAVCVRRECMRCALREREKSTIAHICCLTISFFFTHSSRSRCCFPFTFWLSISFLYHDFLTLVKENILIHWFPDRWMVIMSAMTGTVIFLHSLLLFC